MEALERCLVSNQPQSDHVLKTEMPTNWFVFSEELP